MDTKMTLICVLLLTLASKDLFVQAARVCEDKNDTSGSNETDDKLAKGMICFPGRTILKMHDKPAVDDDNEESDDDDDGRRSHMRFKTDDESCQVCVCSVDGKTEYCSNRPAKNVNECMKVAVYKEQLGKNEPFDHERTLSSMIRRGLWHYDDLMWHKDEIPYDPKAKCLRGTSYYTNSNTANDTDIDIQSDVPSILDYENTSVCFFCVCSVLGDAAGCISRSPWFCEFLRRSRDPRIARDRYTQIFQHDRPGYFRLLSQRMRRTMDDGMYNLINTGGDALCCGHPNGHRRHIHHAVRNKIRLLKNRVNKENLMGGSPGGDYVDFIVNNDKKK